jgi:hypothetical protein
MRKLVAAASAACMLATAALADTATVGPLPPGKPAGVKKADLDDPVLLIVAGIAAIAIIAVAASSGGSKSSSPVTSGTS